MTKIKIAIVGTGFMGDLHARVVKESEVAELACVADVDAARAKEVGERYGVPHVSDLSPLLARGDLEACIVALPDRLHPETTCKILEAGLPVLLEKPMADTLARARCIADSAQKGKARLMVGQLLRFDPRYAQAAEEFRKGGLGELLHATARRHSLQCVGQRMNGKSSVCFFLGVHDIDALQWVTGKRITSVYSRMVSKLMPSLGVGGEDAIFSTLGYEDGSIGSLTLTWTWPNNMPSGINAHLEVVGTKGGLYVDTRDHGLTIVSAASGTTLPDGLHWPAVNNRIVGDLRDEVEHFAHCLRSGEEFTVSVEEAMRNVAVIDAIFKSCGSNKDEKVENV